MVRLSTRDVGREQGLRVTVTADAASEPVSTATMKSYLKIDYSTEDTLIDALVKSARYQIEGYIQRKLGLQTLEATWERYGQKVRLPYAPINSITSVVKKIRDTSETQTLDSDYYVFGNQDKWLEFADIGSEKLIVTYTAGYTTVPEAILTALKRTVATLYELREDARIEDSERGGGLVLDALTKRLLQPYKVMSI